MESGVPRRGLDKVPLWLMLAKAHALIRSTTMHYCRDRRPGWGLAWAVGLIVCERLQASLLICRWFLSFAGPFGVDDVVCIAEGLIPCQ